MFTCRRASDPIMLHSVLLCFFAAFLLFHASFGCIAPPPPTFPDTISLPSGDLWNNYFYIVVESGSAACRTYYAVAIIDMRELFLFFWKGTVGRMELIGGPDLARGPPIE